MNLFKQTFCLLHKNLKIALVMLVSSVLGSILISAVSVGSSTTMVIFASLVAMLVMVTGTILVIGWSNESVLYGAAKEKPWVYLRRFTLPYLGVIVLSNVIFALVNLGLVVKIIKDIPENFNFGTMTERQITATGNWIMEHAGMLSMYLIINLLLMVLFAFSQYVIIIENKGVLHAYKMSVLYSFKGLVVGFFSGLGIFAIFLMTSMISGFLFPEETIIGEGVGSLLSAYFGSLFVLFMVGLYHKLKKSA